MLVKSDGRMLKITQEQTPGRPDEYQRICQNNGLVTVKEGGVARVDGSIAVSRAIGDIKYKKDLISVPEIFNYEIEETDDLLIMSTDGLF